MTAPKTVSWRSHGTQDFADWTPGEAITSVGDLKEGDVVFADSSQLDALNLAVVMAPPETAGRPATLRFVEPDDTRKVRRFASPDGFSQWGGAFLTNPDGTPTLRRAHKGS